MPDFVQFIYWLCLTLLTGAAVCVVAILRYMLIEFRDLNGKMIVIVERVNYHEERISKLEGGPHGSANHQRR